MSGFGGAARIGLGVASTGAQATGIAALFDSIKTQQAGIKAIEIGREASRKGTAVAIEGAMLAGKSAAYQARMESENKARIAEEKAKADGFNAEMAKQHAVSEEQRAGAAAVDFRKGNEAKLASRDARVAASNLTGNSRTAVREAILTESEFGANRIAYEGRLAASRLNNQARLSEMSRRANLETAFFARTAGEESAKNFEEASRIQAAGLAHRGTATDAEFNANIARAHTGIYTTYAAIANESVKTADNLYKNVADPLGKVFETMMGGRKTPADDWGLSSGGFEGYDHGLSADIGGLAW